VEPRYETRAEGIARFQKTGGLPPKGATLLGRWTRADFRAGFDLLESDDLQALAGFALMWSDLMEIEIFRCWRMRRSRRCCCRGWGT
jgi:hypothetical protein